MECKMRAREHVVFLLLTLSIVLNSIVGCVPGATLPTPTSTSSIAISAPSIPSDLVRAREALITYFSLLHAGRYSEAIHYYGGAYDVLREEIGIQRSPKTITPYYSSKDARPTA